MNFRKLKKAAAAVMAAVMCVTMAFGTSVSAAEKKSVWSETKALTTAKYNSKYIKWAEKYSAKEAKNTIAFGKSRTKKFYESQTKVSGSDDPQFIINIIDKETIFSIAVKGKENSKNIKMVAYSDGEGSAIYSNSKNVTLLSVGYKQKLTVPMSENIGYDELFDEMAEGLFFNNDNYMIELGVTDKTKGKTFKFTSNEKTYYYEEFEGSVAGKFGFLFNSSGKPIAAVSGDTAMCFNISFSVKDSEFSIPKGYTDISL
ncbi:MAG: hypothetical protein K2J11_04100 [Oscillospiraceae bacterium]|nr:hypothetical protein [Oscillospiraceae bacterium]